MDADSNPVLLRIRKERGFASKLGKHLKISRAAVWMWKRVPHEYAYRIAEFMDLEPHEVCPEIIPPPKTKHKKTAV